MPQTVQVIRDVISIDAKFPFIAGLEAGDTLRIIAREISLTETYDLKGRNLEVYASTFFASNGAVILNQGTMGQQGRAGDNGVSGLPSLANRDGTDGQVGGPGDNGTDGGSVKVSAEVMTGLQVGVKGGDGGKGGTGGVGGRGATVNVSMGQHPPIVIYLPKGGHGGPGGPGGRGGNGGTVTISSVNYTTDPIIDVSRGERGEGGEGGGFLGEGKIEWIQTRPPVLQRPEAEIYHVDRGGPGKPGTWGEYGNEGVKNQLRPSYDEFYSSLASESFASEWAAYRHAVGEYFFRSYVPGKADRDQYIGMAVDEFKAAIRLNPVQTNSALRLEQIWNNMNPLGLARNLDVIPDFDRYITNFTGLGNLVTTFRGIGYTNLLHSSDLQEFQNIFTSQRVQSDVRIQEANADIEISKQSEEDLGVALKEVEKMIDDVRKRIEKAKEDMKQKPLSFREFVGDVAQLATAVSAVMAAAPTGGASLLVLAPDVISLSKTVYDNATPLVQAIIDDKDTETLALAKSQYKKVKQDVNDIKKASDKVTNLLNVIDIIKGAKTPDNSKIMDLVQKGAELAYEYLLKQQELKKAQMRTKALGEKLASEGALQEFHSKAIARTELNEKIIREAGFKILQAASSKVDLLLDFAFRAQRSIEIYLLKDQSQYVYYDVGCVHPDIEAEYIRNADSFVSLTTSYQSSFDRLLDPTSMWDTYRTYFNRQLYTDIHRRSFIDPETLDTFRSTFTLTFSFDAAALSQRRYNTKIQAIGIAFIGAKGEGDLISCKVEHGAVYSQRMSNGMMQRKTLNARSNIVLATITPLQLGGFDLDSSPSLEHPQNSPLWAMGIGGLYTVTIPNSEFEEHHPTFEGLKEIEVWIGYQFME